MQVLVFPEIFSKQDLASAAIEFGLIEIALTATEAKPATGLSFLLDQLVERNNLGADDQTLSDINLNYSGIKTEQENFVYDQATFSVHGKSQILKIDQPNVICLQENASNFYIKPKQY